MSAKILGEGKKLLGCADEGRPVGWSTDRAQTIGGIEELGFTDRRYFLFSLFKCVGKQLERLKQKNDMIQ